MEQHFEISTSASTEMDIVAQWMRSWVQCIREEAASQERTRIPHRKPHRHEARKNNQFV
ncbi:MAG TPA: hypothetical protein VF681_01970 [Abditibacteriaceae bacterium]